MRMSEKYAKFVERLRSKAEQPIDQEWVSRLLKRTLHRQLCSEDASWMFAPLLVSGNVERLCINFDQALR